MSGSSFLGPESVDDSMAVVVSGTVDRMVLEVEVVGAAVDVEVVVILRVVVEVVGG